MSGSVRREWRKRWELPGDCLYCELELVVFMYIAAVGQAE